MGDCAANLELCRSTLDDGSLSCAVLLLLLGRWPLVERLVSYGICLVLFFPRQHVIAASTTCTAPHRSGTSPPQDPMDGPMVSFFHTPSSADTPHRVSWYAYGDAGAGLSVQCPMVKPNLAIQASQHRNKSRHRDLPPPLIREARSLARKK